MGFHFGFNGQEKDNEVAQGITTAKFWEYDSRLGRRWNLDPKTTTGISDYACFSNNPIWKIDPNGDDDFYNFAGKYIGTYGTGTAIRITGTRTAEALRANINQYGEKIVFEASKVVTIQSNVKESVDALYKESNSLGVERKAYFILNTKEATLTIENQPQSASDTKTSCVNIYDKNTLLNTNDKFINITGDPTKVIVGQIHGHTNPNEKSDPTISGGGYYSSELKPGTSKVDVAAAEEMNVPVNVIDYTGNVSRVNPDALENNNISQDQNLLKESLEISGGKK